MKQYDVVALGELLIDFTETGMSPQGNPLLEVNPGGAPCNVLAMLNNLGRRCAFLGKVGKDSFGDLLIETVRERGIETKGLLQDPDVHTTLAFVHTLPDGDREFSFYRRPGADVSLSENELKKEMIGDCRIFHFGSLSLTDEPCRTATQTALNLAKDAGALISFDPNLREPLWNNLNEAKMQIAWGLKHSDVVKIADNEMTFLTGETDFEKGAAILRAWFPNIRLLNITAGPDGSHSFYGDLHVFVPGFRVQTIETTGAGDTFCACVLHDILNNGLSNRTEESLAAMLRFANAAAAIITTRKGALKSMPTEIDRFASDNAINVMIINSQAFNARGKDANRIRMRLDEFRSRRPIDIIAKTNPIVIIDEPQSVEGAATKERLKDFCPLFTLRYSATHKADSIYNMIYRLDAMEAYNKRLVKKIAVKGITETGSTATEGYVYLQSINLSKSDPTATLQFDVKGASGVRKKTQIVKIGTNLYDLSGKLEEYKNNFVVSFIDGRDDSVSFLNGTKIYAGDVIGSVSEEQMRRIQIRETILSHIDRERQLFHRGIKVLSLFFIDEVAHYKQYDAAGQPYNGVYADMFEEEYDDVMHSLQIAAGEEDYVKYLQSIKAADTHAGYFSIDKKGRMTDSKIGDKKEKTSDDIDAYDLIMKNKELLLDRDPKKSPVRFIFSHSALREGWDNPNVFQICTLKQSSSEVRKRQEVGRGLRLCVNQDGERQDVNVLGNDVQNVNVLTVIASESYESFAKGLQTELAEAVASRPRAVTPELFTNRVITDADGNSDTITQPTALNLWFHLRQKGYIDENNALTDTYYTDKSNAAISLPEALVDYQESVLQILDSVYNAAAMQPENARSNNVELTVSRDKLEMAEFKALWKRINKKSYYVVDFDTDELVRNSVQALNVKLQIPKIFFRVTTGTMDSISSRESLQSGEAFTKTSSSVHDEHTKIAVNRSVKYDLIGKLVDATGLTRKAIVEILTGIEKDVFDQFGNNPEEFILKAAELINDQKATAIIQHITYDLLDDEYKTDIFTDATIKGKLGVNAIKTNKHLYDHVVYDSNVEKTLAENLDTSSDVAVYVKLPSGFYISTPVGKYNPDWAIAFYEDHVKHIYFVAETKGDLASLELTHTSSLEKAKINCARQHFQAISNGDVMYDVVDSYDQLLQKVMR